ncbi:MAG: hypothetical protein J0H77_27230 [Alphaproteobacteria bacterium]|nr:hypothetical protein [Alphaproteobacteria bacterium]
MADTGKLISAAQHALGVIWRDGYRYRKVGVVLLKPEKRRRHRAGSLSVPRWLVYSADAGRRCAQ